MSKADPIKTWFENLTVSSMEEISNIYTEDAYFKDPFKEFSGASKIKLIFKHMFENLENPRFVFIDTIEDNNGVYFTWGFLFKVKGKDFQIHGGSLLKWNSEGKIHYHRDYWDVGEELLLKIPISNISIKHFRKS